MSTRRGLLMLERTLGWRLSKGGRIEGSLGNYCCHQAFNGKGGKTFFILKACYDDTRIDGY